jgi:hypothetical protein
VLQLSFNVYLSAFEQAKIGDQALLLASPWISQLSPSQRQFVIRAGDQDDF